MILESIKSYALTIPFTSVFKHASASRTATQSLWIEARTRDGAVGFGEGCPREYVTAEDLTSSATFVARYSKTWMRDISDLAGLREWAAAHRADIDSNPAAWSAVELALLDLMAKETNQTVESMLGLAALTGSFQYSAVLGDSSDLQFDARLARYLTAGFSDFKIKLSGEATRDLAKVRSLCVAGIPPTRVRADANNLWSDAEQAIAHLAELDYAFLAIEEPLRAGDYVGMAKIAMALNTAIILDESMLRVAQLRNLDLPSVRWILNLRVSKMGGLLRSLELLDLARGQGLQVIVGAHVGETSLLTRSALTVASTASDMLIAQEGAFGTQLLSCDVVHVPLMFGAGGILDIPTPAISGGPGFGITVAQPVPHLTALVAPAP
jgi:L-alanine-DL-glutamate epimerase-like enolase superfamily enzyme